MKEVYLGLHSNRNLRCNVLSLKRPVMCM